ncbi:ATP-binding cassette domain-containing protein [Mycobacterium sp.]|uniref:ATP-binding cassette domain-containing protein n=1 Tax=Mycobacterium sp. TaxID=1785 RepID=UPI0025E4AC93|nr:ATP-binding cassette domain-containing protein [Mycobacterium sp.]
MSVLELRDLTIGYRRRRRATVVAAGLSAVAGRGELTVLLGPNGCGKSTLIRTMCGLQPALGGQVSLDGTDLAGVAADRLARRVAVVLTDPVDPGLLSARELAALGRIPYLGVTGRLSRDDHDIVEQALAAVGAGHLADRPAADLSDGERQRVLTARALAQQPDVLVLDEPTAFLDVPSRVGLIAMLRRLAREQGLTIVLSTHDLELALREADRAWLLGCDGTLVDTTPGRLTSDGQLNAVFGCEITPSSDPAAVTALAELSDVSGYFALGTGPLASGWRPVRQLYDDTALLGEVVGRVAARMRVTEQRVAASTFFLGFAARLWSIGLGAVAGYQLLVDLPPDRLLYRQSEGQIALHLERPATQQRDDLHTALADLVLDRHLEPLAAALRRLGPISRGLFHGNAASALLGAARVFDSDRATTSGWQLARRICDERLSAAVSFADNGYRRTSCCLYYRTPGGGLCGDCALDRVPERC